MLAFRVQSWITATKTVSDRTVKLKSLTTQIIVPRLTVLFFQADRMAPTDASKGMKVSIRVMVLRIIQMSIRASMMDNARKSGAEQQGNHWASAWLYVQ